MSDFPRRGPGRSALLLLLVVPALLLLFMLAYVCRPGECFSAFPVVSSASSPPVAGNPRVVDTKAPPPEPPPRHCPPEDVSIVSVNSAGRLGNIMSEYASLLALSVRYNRTAWILEDTAQKLSKVFIAPSLPVMSSTCDILWNRTSIEHLKDMLPSDKEPVPNYLIVGYPHDVSGFAPLRTQLKKEFQFIPKLREHAEQTLRSVASAAGWAPHNITFVGVHVRRTDYAQWLLSKVQGRLVGADYLRRAMALIRRRYPQAVFVVTSDDLHWCRTHLEESGVLFLGTHDLRRPGADLALLAACNHTIVTHGTFGFWAAFLAGGDVIRPAGYAHNPSWLDVELDRAGLGWTKLKAFVNN